MVETEERLSKIESKIDIVIEMIADAERNKERIEFLNSKNAELKEDIEMLKTELMQKEKTLQSLERENKRLEKSLDELDYWCRTFF